jgi:Family of unknown function (DUF6885)
MVPAHEPERQQRDGLCGPFHGARVLLEAGVSEWDGAALDQDLVALHAGTTLPLRPRGEQVPAGARSLRDYRHELPLVDPARAGTAPSGLAGAIELLSMDRLRCVPLRGSWTEDAVARLLDAAPRLRARLLANIRTGKLWGSRPPLEALLAQLAGREPPPVPAAEWDVGHYVEIALIVRGPGGALVVVRDSYPSLGWNAHHLQPPHAIVAALTRGDRRDGGVLALVPADGAEPVRELAAELSLETELWDNGSGGS